MEPSASLSPESFIGWYDRVKEYFTDFKPETRNMSINFSRRTSVIGFQINVPNGFRKNARKVKIPALDGYNILRMTDEGFREQKHLWRLEDGHFVLDAKNLPASERYLVEMEGAVDENALKSLIFIKPSANRDNDDENDRYWLESSIKQPRTLEKIYDDLEIEDVHFGVYVDIDKMFGLTLPQEVKGKTDALQKLLKTSSSNFDRNQLLRAALEYKKQERVAPSFNPGDFFRIIQRLTARDVIRQHIEIDRPYDVGNIDQPEKYVGIVPQSIKVQAITRLTLRTPLASGYLVFKREKYMNKLRTEFEKLV
ncbi:MAG: hypothetical protein AB1608_01555 [Thermoproteota archaeon]